MCISSSSFSAVHQLRPISAASDQWNSRTGRSQTGCFAPFNSMVFPIEVVARLARLAEVAERRLGRAGVAALRRGVERARGLLEGGVLGGEVLRILPDFRLGLGLADVGPGSGREPARRFLRQAIDRSGGASNLL